MCIETSIQVGSDTQVFILAFSIVSTPLHEGIIYNGIKIRSIFIFVNISSGIISIDFIR